MFAGVALRREQEAPASRCNLAAGLGAFTAIFRVPSLLLSILALVDGAHVVESLILVLLGDKWLELHASAVRILAILATLLQLGHL